jgi:hypothetical protein
MSEDVTAAPIMPEILDAPFYIKFPLPSVVISPVPNLEVALC